MTNISMPEKSTLILDHTDIEQKVKRIAYEILENNYDEKEIILIGIKDNGFTLAKKIHDFLLTFSHVKLSLHFILLNKENPADENVQYDFDPKELNKKVVILVDDVGNTGRTLSYALKPLLTFLPKKIQVALLVDRQHKSFPISADYVGLSLSTTMKETVLVKFSGKEEGAYLS